MSELSEAERDELEAVRLAINHDLSPSLALAHWACDPLPSCPQYAHVNPEWLLELITEAKAIRAAMGEPL